MCRRVTCSTCGKPDWAGCGAHIEQVLGNVPQADRCHCRSDGAGKKAAPGLLETVSGWFGGKAGKD